MKEWNPMRLLTASALLALAPALVSAEPPLPRGVQMADLNRNVNACSDFYEYANGSWRANNPIPPSMVRWSRRWAAGETAKDQLRAILDEVSAKQDWPARGVEQLIGDHYASCMDEARIDAAGVTPIQPMLKE